MIFQVFLFAMAATLSPCTVLWVGSPASLGCYGYLHLSLTRSLFYCWMQRVSYPRVSEIITNRTVLPHKGLCWMNHGRSLLAFDFYRVNSFEKSPTCVFCCSVQWNPIDHKTHTNPFWSSNRQSCVKAEWLWNKGYTWLCPVLKVARGHIKRLPLSTGKEIVQCACPVKRLKSHRDGKAQWHTYLMIHLYRFRGQLLSVVWWWLLRV